MKSSIQGLGEIALQVSDMDSMASFYADVVGLELMMRDRNIAFFRIADGVAGHMQVLALFDRHSPGDQAPPTVAWRRPPLDHIAFGIDLADFEYERSRLEALGADVRSTTHAWVGWRSLYVDDPEGNVVEWVCYDESVKET